MTGSIELHRERLVADIETIYAVFKTGQSLLQA